MDFREMFTDLFNTGFLTSEELETIIKAGELYAAGKAKNFAKWINAEGYQEYDEADRWISPEQSNTVYTTAQLYEKFEKAKTPVTSRG